MRFRKPYTPNDPGSWLVHIHIQAGTVMGGMTLSRRPHRPPFISRRIFLRRSSGKTISGAAQSSPRTQIFIRPPPSRVLL